MAQIVPAILETTTEAFERSLSLVCKLPGLNRIQVDFGDGAFIDNRLVAVSDIDTLNPALEWEAHLMVKAPIDFLDYQICGFKTIIVHFEAFASADVLKATLESIKKMGLKTGVAINPSTSVKVLQDITADQYLIMSVVPGKQGQLFIPSTIEKVKELRQMLPHAIIEVDGGVNETNIFDIKQAGADLICVGSALVKAPDMHLAYAHLEDKII
jgi:ribulose-phosphate 3-epimerase